MYSLILGLILALALAVILSYPPQLPPNVVKAYDYPIIRLLVLSGIFGLAYYYPEFAIILAIAYAILADDIVKTSARVKGEGNENFTSASASGFNMINLLPGPSEVQEASKFVGNTNGQVSLDTLLGTIKQLETQVQDLSRKTK